MFDAYAQSLFENLPDFVGLEASSARRMLSRAYLAVVELRTSTAEASEEAIEAIEYLRRLADTVEFYAVLDEAADVSVVRAGAFVTAECLALLADFYAEFEEEEEFVGSRIQSNEYYTRMESAILYLIAGYDACAAGVVGAIQDERNEEIAPSETGAEWCLDVLKALCKFQLNPLPSVECPVQFADVEGLSAKELESDTTGRLFAKLGEATAKFLAWLAGELPNGAEDSNRLLEQILNVLEPPAEPVDIAAIGGDYARIRHLAMLLRVCFPGLGERALVHVVPTGPGFDEEGYQRYLKARASGEKPGESGRPVLWPSAEAYVSQCITGDAQHAVVSMPTGSGKSFVAELAITQGLGNGWCLYLAPTNALTEQIRGDLRNGLRSLGTEVLAFIGDQEYSVLKTNVVSEMPPNSVAVMTPEKAFLALRLFPEVFTTCQLVVFDECHLLGEGNSGRGVTAELVLTQLMLKAPGCRFLLMSAIVQNPEDLAAWLESSTSLDSAAIQVPWRPTRTLRTALGVDTETCQKGYDTAKAKLEKLPAHRKNQKFTSLFAMACGLQGAWQTDEKADYGIVKIPCDAELCVSRKKVGNKWDFRVSPEKWVNGSSVGVAEYLAENEIQTLVFCPASKHYPFSNASNTKLSDECFDSLDPDPDIIDICRVLAEHEFGIESEVFTLIGQGLSVHTSHMIETEKIASETAFRNRSTRIMYATGTLAQGLNLPATAVVIGGTRIGDPRGEDREVVEQRKLSQLLNAAGRAGRAGFANQGLVIAIPDEPLLLDSYDEIDNLKNQLKYFQQSDNAVPVNSGLESFLDQVTKGVLSTEAASVVELQTIAALSGGDEGQPLPIDVLRNSYAAYQRHARGEEEVNEDAASHLEELRDAFVNQDHVPTWVPIAAQRSGLDFFLTVALVNAWQRVRETVSPDVLEWSVFDWTEELLKVLSYVPPGVLLRSISSNAIKRGVPQLDELIDDDFRFITQRDWIIDEQWSAGWTEMMGVLRPWMTGVPLISLASIITGRPEDEIITKRTAGSQPIPKVIALINDLFSSLSILGGGLVAVAEQLFDEFAEQGNASFEAGVPLALSCMPMSIKYGCDSPGALAWFRFGVRLRRPSRLLYEAFPPPELEDDELLRKWVRQQRGEWLAGEADTSGNVFDEHKGVFEMASRFIRRE